MASEGPWSSTVAQVHDMSASSQRHIGYYSYPPFLVHLELKIGPDARESIWYVP